MSQDRYMLLRQQVGWNYIAMTDEEIEQELEDRNIDLILAKEKAINSLFKVVLSLISKNGRIWRFDTYNFMQRLKRW